MSVIAKGAAAEVAAEGSQVQKKLLAVFALLHGHFG